MSGTVIGLILGSLASLCWGIADFIARGATRKVGERQTLFWVLAIGGVGVACYTIPHGVQGASPAVAGMVLITALLALFGYLALYRAFRVGMLSVVSGIASCNAIIPVILALVLLGERPLPWQYGGIAIVFVGVVMLSLRKNGTILPEGTHTLGVAPALLAAALFGLSLFGMKLSVDAIDPATVALAVRVIGIVTLGAMLLWRRELSLPNPAVRGALLAAGILDAAAFILFCEALTHTLLSLVAPISSTIPLVTVTLAWFILKERLSLGQWLGLGLTLTGIALVAVT